MSMYRRLDVLLDTLPPPPPPLPAFTTTATFLYNESFLFRPTPLSLISPFSDQLFLEQPCYNQNQIGYILDFLAPPSPFSVYSPPRDLLEIAMHERAQGIGKLAERVAALEMGVKDRKTAVGTDRKYKWTAELKTGNGIGDRRYKCVARANAAGERDVKWTEQLRGKGSELRTYTFQTASSPAGVARKVIEEKGTVKKKKAISKKTTRAVEITDPKTDQGTIFLKKAFAKRTADKSKGKGKEMSPQDAALLIQMSFRSYLVRRSQVLCGLRDLAIAKAKLKEIRALFSNFTYRHRIECDAEERQRFSEKIVVLLLTVDSIEGPDCMIRSARRSMVNELEAMLEVIDPKLPSRLGSIKRRTFDMPDGSAIHNAMASGVADVIQMLNEEDGVVS